MQSFFNGFNALLSKQASVASKAMQYGARYKELLTGSKARSLATKVERKKRQIGMLSRRSPSATLSSKIKLRERSLGKTTARLGLERKKHLGTVAATGAVGGALIGSMSGKDD